MHDEYTMRRIAGSAIDASPIRRLDCAGFQLDVDSGNPEARYVPSRALRKRLSNAKKQKQLVFAGCGPDARFNVLQTGFRSVDLRRTMRLRPAVFLWG